MAHSFVYVYRYIYFFFSSAILNAKSFQSSKSRRVLRGRFQYSSGCEPKKKMADAIKTHKTKQERKDRAGENYYTKKKQQQKK